MSIKIMSRVFDSDVQPTAARFVLLALADNANDGGFCRPGIAYLSGKTGMSRSTVFRGLATLEEEQLIARRERRRANGSRQSNAYRINVELLIKRSRKITSEEECELAALFDDSEEPQVSASCQPDTMPEEPQVSAWCQSDTGDTAWCQPDTGGGVTVTLLEPSVGPKEDPPQPPAQRGEPVAPPKEKNPSDAYCDQHSRRNCRECRLSPRVQAREAKDLAEAEMRKQEAIGRSCSMCKPDGPARDGGTRWIRVLPGTGLLVSPADVCDHVTPHQVRVKELAEIEAVRVDLDRPAKLDTIEPAGEGHAAAMAFRPSGKFRKPERPVIPARRKAS